MDKGAWQATVHSVFFFKVSELPLLLLLLLVMSNSVRPHRQQPTRLPRPWDSPGKNTAVGCHFLLQGIFPTQGSNLRLMSPALAGGFCTTSTNWEAQLRPRTAKLKEKKKGTYTYMYVYN